MMNEILKKYRLCKHTKEESLKKVGVGKEVDVQAEQLIDFFDKECTVFWKEQPEMWIDLDTWKGPLPDYSNYEQYL